MSPETPRAVFTESFTELNPLLRHEIVDFVFEGRELDLPSRMDAASRAEIASVDAKKRAEFYLHLEDISHADDAMILRLGQLLARAIPERGANTGLVPAPITAVLRDAVHAVFGSAKTDPPFTSLSADRIAALMVLAGVPADDVPSMVIAALVKTAGRPESYRYREPVHQRGICSIPGVAEFLAAHPLEVHEFLEQSPIGAVLEILRHATTHLPLAEVCAELIAECATSAYRELRKPALPVLGSLPVRTQVEVLHDLLGTVPANRRPKVIAAIERIPDFSQAIALLERVEGGGSNGSEDIDRAIERLTIFELCGAPKNLVVTPMIPLNENPLDTDSVESIRTALAAYRENKSRLVATIRSAKNPSLTEFPGIYSDETLVRHERDISAVDSTLASLDFVVGYLSGRAEHPGSDVLESLQHVRKSLVGFETINWVRASARPDKDRYWHSFYTANDETVDARALVDALVRSGHSEIDAHAMIVKAALTSEWQGPILKPVQLVEYMAEYPHHFDVIMGLEAGEMTNEWIDNRGDVLAILEASPKLASRYLPVVTELIVGSAKTLRTQAFQVLDRHGLAERIAQHALRIPDIDVRVGAIVWMESHSGQWTLEQLAHQLELERTPSVRATIIATLERLGRNIGSYLEPATLLAEAQVGLKKAVPKELAWFPFDDLPAAEYVDGGAVAPDVLRWWVILAFTLKDPAGAGLLPLYVRTLSTESAATLGRFILTTWLARDATKDDAKSMERAFAAAVKYSQIAAAVRLVDPTLPEAASDVVVSDTVVSDTAMDAELRALFDSLEEHTREEISDDTEQLFDHFEWERQREERKAPSAIHHRGILALAGRVPGAELAQIVRQFMKRKHLKRAQIEALLVTLSLSDDPEPTQLLVATARRYRSVGIQTLARTLVEEIAKGRGWSADELADRMIPTAGLDASRRFEIDYGPRSFTARVGSTLTLTLETAGGDALKSLPVPRKEDLLGAAAKAKYAANKKDLAAVVAIQRRRLYDAMCLRREWSGAEWDERLLTHPIMGLLVAGLVWHIDAKLARPDVSGIVRAIDGTAINVEANARVSIAHTTTASARDRHAWQAQPAEVQIGFDQFRAPSVIGDGGESSRTDCDGVQRESFRLRSRAATREWDRGETGDGGSFNEYVKRFESVGLEGVLTFSGSAVLETDIPIQLGPLSVRRIAASGSGATVQLSELPAALLAELVADYLYFGNE